MEAGLSWETLGVVLTAVFTAMLAYYALRTYRLQKVEADRRKWELEARVRTYSAIFLNPAKFVGAFVVKTKTYLPISKDKEIRAAIEESADVLIMGRGGIGKSHTAITHIRRFAARRWYQRWRVIAPDRLNLPGLRFAPLRRRNYIVLFDDLDEYISLSDGSSVFDVIDKIRDASKRIRIIATVRSTSPAIDAISETKYFSRFRTVLLDDWTDLQREQLASKTDVPASYWDGTPLSAKQPSEEQRLIYERLVEGEQMLLECLKVCDTWGLHYCDRNLLYKTAALTWQRKRTGDFERAAKTIARLGFLKRSDTALQAYGPYLAFIADQHKNEIFESLRTILLEPGFTLELFVVGRTAYDQEQYDVSELLLEKLVEREPAIESGHYRLGLIQMRRGNPKAAIPHLARAVAVLPNYFSAWFRLATAYKRIGEKELSEQAFATARKVRLGINSGNLLMLADMARISGELEEALELITQYLKADPDIRSGWGIKGQILLRLGRNDQAQAAFREAIARNPDMFVYFGLGQSARARNEWPLAVESFQKAIELNPNFAEAYPLLGQALHKVGRQQEAAEAFHKAIDLGQVWQGYFGQGLVAKAAGNWPEAITALEAAVAANSDFGLAYSYLATGYEKTNRLTEALKAHQSAVRLEPKSKHNRYSYAMALLKDGRKEAAIAELKNCLKIDPDFARAKERLEKLRISPVGFSGMSPPKRS